MTHLIKETVGFTTNDNVIINDILSQTITKNKATLGCSNKEDILNAIGVFCHTRITHVHTKINKHAWNFQKQFLKYHG